MRSVLVSVIFLANLAVAHAQAPGESAPPTPQEITLHKKDPNKATLLTALGVAVPGTLFVLGARTESDDMGPMLMGLWGGFVLPAAGHWYTNHIGTYGMLARMGGVVFFMTGVSEIDDAKKCARGIEVTDGCDGVSRGVGRAAIGLGVSLYVGSLVYDVISSRREVREYNSHHKIQVIPTMTQSSTGLALGGTF